MLLFYHQDCSGVSGEKVTAIDISQVNLTFLCNVGFDPFVHKIETDSTTNTKKEMSAYEIMLRCIKKVDVYHKDGSWFLPLCRYEEDNYMRLPALSKKEKHRQRKSMTTVTSVGKELTYFGSNNFFNESGAGGDNPRSGKKRKSTSGKKSSAKTPSFVR